MRLHLLNFLTDAYNVWRGTPNGAAHVEVQAPPKYKAIAASSNVSVGALGGNGAVGDFLEGLTIVPSTTSPGAVTVKDGDDGAITLFAGGASSVGNLTSFHLPVKMTSKSGALAITTGANVSVVATGKWTD